MTKDKYYEMCEALGNDPKEEELPVEYTDLPVEVQQCVYLYNSLQDNWDYFGGNYIGKNMTDFWNLLNLHGIDLADAKFYYETVRYIDQVRAKQIAQEQKSKQKPAK